LATAWRRRRERGGSGGGGVSTPAASSLERTRRGCVGGQFGS
jgi:hypothetical protein